MLLKYTLSFLTIILVLSLSGCNPHPAKKDSMWRCNASDARHMHWSQYSPTRVEAAKWVRDRCKAGTYRSTCVVHCFPPKSRWHCIAVDAKGHTWYRNSVNRVKAIQNARRACQRRSAYGACKVKASNCSVI